MYKCSYFDQCWQQELQNYAKNISKGTSSDGCLQDPERNLKSSFNFNVHVKSVAAAMEISCDGRFLEGKQRLLWFAGAILSSSFKCSVCFPASRGSFPGVR